MAAPRNENIREKILDATDHLLQSKSLSDITLSEIARETGISKGTLYYYYKNKTDIYMDVSARYLDHQYDDLIAWVDNKEKDTSIHRLVLYVVTRNIKDYRTRLHLINAASLGDEEIKEKLIKLYATFENLISEKVGERSQLFDSRFFAQLMLLCSDGLIVQEALGNKDFDAEGFVNQSVEYIKILDSLVKLSGEK